MRERSARAAEDIDVPDALASVLQRCAAAELPPNVALMQLIGAARSPAELEDALAAASSFPWSSEEAEHVQRLAALWQQSPPAWDTVKSVLGEVDRQAADATVPVAERFSRLFDRLAVSAPDAASALYALGRADLLDAATRSIVDRLFDWGLAGRDRDILDLGCGSGRLTLALAPSVRTVVGVDASPAMLARARERARGIANAAFRSTAGTDLGGLADASFDLVVAVDVFPYVVPTAGLAEAYFREAARVLRPGGSLVVFNLSYQLSLEDQRRMISALAATAGLEVVRSGTRDLEWWDGVTFHLVRPAGNA